MQELVTTIYFIIIQLYILLYNYNLAIQLLMELYKIFSLYESYTQFFHTWSIVIQTSHTYVNYKKPWKTRLIHGTIRSKIASTAQRVISQVQNEIYPKSVFADVSSIAEIYFFYQLFNKCWLSPLQPITKTNDNRDCYDCI